MISYPDESFTQASKARATLYKFWNANRKALEEVEQYILARYEQWFHEEDAVTGSKMASLYWVDDEPATLRLELFDTSYMQFELRANARILFETSLESRSGEEEFIGIQFPKEAPRGLFEEREPEPIELASLIQELFDAAAEEAQSEASALSEHLYGRD